MPLALGQPEATNFLAAAKKRWTRIEARELAAAGLIDATRYELLGGELVKKMGKGRAHVAVLMILAETLRQIFGWGRVVTEQPIDVATSDSESNEPEPDLTVTNRELSHFLSRNPGPGDLDLVVEVAGSTRLIDLGFKAALYAQAGIRDYWVVDLDRRRIVVHRQPSPGGFREILAYGEGEDIPLTSAPGASVNVTHIFAC